MEDMKRAAGLEEAERELRIEESSIALCRE